MPEPHASTAIGAAAGAGIAAPWWLFGADPGALILGLIAATLASFWLAEISSRARAACAVGLAGLLAGFGAPNALAGIVAYYPAVQLTESAVPLLGLLIGLAAPSMVPVVLNAASRMMGRVGS